MTMTITEELRQFVNDNFLFGQGIEDLTDDDSFLEKGIIDSTGVLQLVGYIEETYGVRLEDEELIPENLDSLSRVAAFLAKKTASSPKAAGVCK